MKLSEFAEQRQSAEEAQRAEHKRRCAKVLHAAEAVPAWSGSDSRARVQKSLREQLTAHVHGHSLGSLSFSGLECDDCGVELIAGALLMSDPPRKQVMCAGCGFFGSVPT